MGLQIESCPRPIGFVIQGFQDPPGSYSSISAVSVLYSSWRRRPRGLDENLKALLWLHNNETFERPPAFLQ